ncbi:HAD family hydrolase [Pseudohalioglobus lutimaris]|uniref:HAD family hydrolase n=1 Tax=Pseudohalioglobus lutimaris TaxID=1737061 RepID=A0A2N5X241_9GAMM|nr:HAD family hydrolase [Pseudohalioglobus lutimaris]PLW68562.1 HAD family hydrolase [Pseudohalioglobus lutimaris]
MPIKVITFDLDNTLWDVEPALIRAEEAQRAWLLEHRPGTMEQYDHARLWEFKKRVWQRHPELLHNVSAMREQMLLELQLAAGYAEKEARVGAEQAFAVFLQQRHQVELYEEALEILEALSRDFTLGALTNGNADIFKTDAGEYFDFAFLAEDVGASKPAPDMFHAAMASSGATATNIIHVGDNPEHDIQGARAVGMYTVWVNTLGQKWPGGERAHREVISLKDLPAAIDSIATEAPGERS